MAELTAASQTVYLSKYWETKHEEEDGDGLKQQDQKGAEGWRKTVMGEGGE